MSSAITAVLLLVFIYSFEGEHQISPNVTPHQIIGLRCITTKNGVELRGLCRPPDDCPSVLLSNVRNHDVCGYVGTQPIICCPTLQKLNLTANVECRIAPSNKIGTMKFLADCPELNETHGITSVLSPKLCNYEVCSDLVCCPVHLKNRLKNVCWNVDHPIQTIDLRLHLNQECTIAELNITGRYQTKCDYAERNPQLKLVVKNVCNDAVCDIWYCCPIEDHDNFYCSANYINYSSHIAKLIGPKCVDSKSGRQGTCKPRYDCQQPSSVTSLPMDKCGLHCCIDYFCCPDDFDDDTFQSSTDRECFSYTKHLAKEEIEVPMNIYTNQTKCVGLVSPAGGVLALPGEFPHMAALGYDSDDNQISWNCGGSLISNRFVLTAAHCLLQPVKKVRLGITNLLNDINAYDCPEEYDVAQIVLHPEYTRSFAYNDIGLIGLNGLVKFNFHIRPICLPTNSDLSETRYKSMGWGAVGAGEKKTLKLIKVNQDLFSHAECQELYSQIRRVNRGVLNETQICAGSSDSIQSTCPGDSGGPLLTHHPKYRKLFNIYGIVSFGVPCGVPNRPGIYTKVFPYVKWIEAIVWP